MIAIGVQIGLYNLHFDTFGSGFQACSAIFFAVFLVVAPCMFIRKAVKNFKNLKDRLVWSQYGALYSDLRLESGKRVFF